MIKNRLVLIDAYALIFRAYYSIPAHFSDSLGRPTNAVYGFVLALLNAINELQPEYLAVGIDVGKSNHHKEYKDYKAHRPPAPDDLKAQVPLVYEVAKAMNIPMIGVEGYEGEDIIATIVAKIRNPNDECKIESIIVTGDMDTLQLIDEATKVYINGRSGQQSTLYDAQKVKERYGLTPTQFVDYKALRGDPSDNIPGVPGIGEKTATMLIQKFNSLDELYTQISKSEFLMSNQIPNPNAKKQKELAENKKISEKVTRLLIENKQTAFLSQKLATIQKNAPIEFKLRDARIHDYDQKKVVELFQKLGFKSLIPRLHTEIKPENPQQSLF